MATTKKATGGNQLLDILKPTPLANLRKGFDNAEMIKLAQIAINDQFDLAKGWGNWAIDTFFVEPLKVRMPARERQRTTLAMFVEREQPLLGVHIYWSLCCHDPLEPEDIAETLLLASNYRGIDLWNQAAQSLTTTLTALQKVAKDGPVSAAQALGAISDEFNGLTKIDTGGGK